MYGNLRWTAGTDRAAPPPIARTKWWFDAASTDKPGAANRAFEIPRTMLASARR